MIRTVDTRSIGVDAKDERSTDDLQPPGHVVMKRRLTPSDVSARCRPGMEATETHLATADIYRNNQGAVREAEPASEADIERIFSENSGFEQGDVALRTDRHSEVPMVLSRVVNGVLNPHRQDTSQLATIRSLHLLEKDDVRIQGSQEFGLCGTSFR